MPSSRRVAVLGAGPAGFFAARALARRGARVDVFDSLPVPFGLLRYGVAPDHPATKNPARAWSTFMTDSAPAVRFRGNVPAALPATLLAERYATVIRATGPAGPRPLPPTTPVSAVAAPSVRLAHDFVLWLNGHPAMHSEAGDLSTPQTVPPPALPPSTGGTVAVIGVGNVALDVARLLLRRPDALWASDASPSAVDAIAGAAVGEVALYGRRGPADAAWTAAALREVAVGEIPGIRRVVIGAGGGGKAAVHAAIADGSLDRTTSRKMKILAGLPSFEEEEAMDRGGGRIRFEFGMTPAAFRGGSVDDVEVEFKDAGDSGGGGGTRMESAGMALLSLGYEGGATGVIQGKDDDSAVRIGWARGSGKGVIADNKWDAEGAVAAMSGAEIGLGDGSGGFGDDDGLDSWLRNCGQQVVDWNGWERIDAEERRRGPALHPDRERIKIQSFAEMLSIAGEFCTRDGHARGA